MKQFSERQPMVLVAVPFFFSYSGNIMIRSMTGFGEAQCEADGNAYHVEIRTVNNRYFKASLRLPEDFAFMESDLERILRERLVRGSVNFRLYVRTISEDAAYELNVGVLQSYMRQLQVAADNEKRATIDMAVLATLPGVCLPKELTEAEREKRWEVAAKLTNDAVKNLIEMRTVEGKSVGDDLSKQCGVVAACLDGVKERVPMVVEEYHTRLFDRIQALIASQNVTLAEEDILKEVAIYADRSDINEEISRMHGHLEQFAAVMNGKEAAGRKLEFIAQEMLREANTMGSKSGDKELARFIIDMKSAIDRIKEQVQNVE